MTLLGSIATTSATESLSLNGAWQARIDEVDKGLSQRWFAQPLKGTDEVALPGSLAQNGLGHRFDPQTGRYDELAPPYLKWPSAGYTDEHRRDDLGVLVADRMSYGPAWFERTIEIPSNWENRHVRLSLERVKWASQLWVDGKEVEGEGTRSLHTPHIYDLGNLSPGPHRLTLRIDNRPQVPIGLAGHGYGMETEPLWLGTAGELQLIALDPLRVERAAVLPAADRRSVQVHLELASIKPIARKVALTVRVVDPENGHELGRVENTISSTDPLELTIPLKEAAQGWDEFNPKLYEIRWEIGSVHTGNRRVGFRTFKREGRSITLNGQPIFLRGNLDCAIHPESQTPPTDRAWWERVLKIHKEAGFNHIRFHTWCPPEVAFEVADEMGLYLQIETAYWVDDWIHGTPPFPPTIGMDQKLDDWVEEESMRIIRRFEHHPSFAMFCIGNEFGKGKTDWDKMLTLVTRLNTATDHLLVSGTCARKSLKADEYWVTHTTGKAARGIGPDRTDWDFSAAVQNTDKPVIAHETGQRPSWPDYDALLPKFKGGVMQPWNLKRLKARAEEEGCTAHSRRAEASARFALLQYKSEHEAMRRTPAMAGYQLLMLHDFTGQGEAHVGLLDPFYDEKPGITLEAIRAWNGPTVPLARFERYTWSSDQTFAAKLEVAHEGPGPLENSTPRWALTTAEGQTVAEGKLDARTIPSHALTQLGSISVPLKALDQPTALRLSLQVGEISNHWNLWVYPSAESQNLEPQGVHISRMFDADVKARLARGDTVFLLPHGSILPTARKLSWASTYWTGAWGWGNGMGLLVDPNHPALVGFPTEAHSDWQWHELLQGGTAIAVPPAMADQAMVVEALADFHMPAREACVFEAKVGSGKLLVCSLDLTSNLGNRPVARTLRASLLDYAASDAFNPVATLAPDEATELLRAAQFGKSGVVAIEADSAQAENSPENVLDGNPNTIWHTRWGAIEPPHPHHLSLDLGDSRHVTGLNLLPRQDDNKGRFKKVAVYASADGQRWGKPIHTATLKDEKQVQKLRFPAVKTRFIKLEILSEVAGRAWSSLAELEIVDEK